MLPKEDITDANLIDTVALWKPDLLFFKLHKFGGVRPDTIKYISEHTKTTTFNYFGDDEKVFDVGEKWDSKHMASNFNYVGTNYEPALKLYDKMGVKAIYSQYGCNEKYCRKLNIKKDINVSFCGVIKPARISFLNELVVKDIMVQVFGPGWGEGKDANSRLLNSKEYVFVMNSSRINLNLNKDSTEHGIKCQQIKGRDFEVPMMGQFLLVDYFSELKKYFKLGKEIETFKDAQECADKIRFYLKREDLREQIAKAGYVRAHKDHTYMKRFKVLLSKIKLKSRGGS